MPIIPNISRSKSKQTIEFGQLIQYNKDNIFISHAENEAGGQVPVLLLFFQKVLYEKSFIKAFYKKRFI